jgi:hypothetical protein
MLLRVRFAREASSNWGIPATDDPLEIAWFGVPRQSFFQAFDSGGLGRSGLRFQEFSVSRESPAVVCRVCRSYGSGGRICDGQANQNRSKPPMIACMTWARAIHRI